MTTFLLVPGAGGAAWSWHLVVRELAARGHRAVAVDLPADDEDAGLADYVASVVRAAPEDDDDLAVVAQSLGGLVAPLVCDHLPVRLVALLNAMIPTPGETGGEWWERTGQASAMATHARSLGLELAALEDPAVLYGHDLPRSLFEESGRHMRDQSGRPFADPWPRAAWPEVPTRVIAAREDRLFPLEFQRRVARERLGLVPDEVDGGHSALLSHPEQVAALLDGYSRDLIGAT